MSLTLYINKSDSRCECSYKGVDFKDTICPHCGGMWTHLSSDYGSIRQVVEPLRPDLIPTFEWEGFWESEAGRIAQQELQDLNTAEEME